MRRYHSPIARRCARLRAAEHPQITVRAASAARVAPRTRKKKVPHGAQTRPRGASLGPPLSLGPTGPTLMRQCDATARRSRDGARVRALPNTPKWPGGQPRLRARRRRSQKKKVTRSPDATQRRQFSPPTIPSTQWTHSGASMRRYGSPIARRGARSRAAEHPKMATRAALAARAVPRRRKKRCHGAQTRPRGASSGPPPPPVPTGPTLLRQCDAMARRSHDGARVRAPPNTPKWPRGQPRRCARAARRRKRSHRPQTRPMDVNLGPLLPPVPPGTALVRRCVVTARSAPVNRPRV